MMKKLVVVTGASSGIGMEFAKRFSSEGHPVLMLARRKEVMEELIGKPEDKGKSSN